MTTLNHYPKFFLYFSCVIAFPFSYLLHMGGCFVADFFILWRGGKIAGPPSHGGPGAHWLGLCPSGLDEAGADLSW